jgi:hypothetical protein
MKHHSSHVFLFVVVAVASCGGGASPVDQSLTGGSLTGAGVRLTTGESSYQAGASVNLAVENLESERLAYNACTRTLEVLEGTAWKAGPASLRLCSKEVWYIEAGESRLAITDLDLGLVPGVYRIVLTFARDYAPDGVVINAVSNPFTITP